MESLTVAFTSPVILARQQSITCWGGLVLALAGYNPDRHDGRDKPAAGSLLVPLYIVWQISKMYLGPRLPKDSVVNPLYSNSSEGRLPPLYVLADGAKLLEDNITRFASKVRQCGDNTTVEMEADIQRVYLFGGE